MRWCLTAIALLAAMPAAAQTTILEGRIGTAIVSVQHPPAAPHVKLRLSGEAQEIDFVWTGPSGEQFYQIFNGAPFKGQPLFQGYRDSFFPDGPQTDAGFHFFGQSNDENQESEWGPYAEPGRWTLFAVSVCTATGVFNPGCTTYSGAALASLFPALTFKLVNAARPDFQAPKIAAVTVLTPSVSISSGQPVEFLLDASDDVSGIEQSQICAATPGPTGAGLCASIFLSEPAAAGKLRLSIVPGTNQAAGAYTVNFVGVRDVARNPNQITDPAIISTLFNGHPTFTLTP